MTLVLLGIILVPQMAWAATDVVRSGNIIVPAEEKIFGDVVSILGDVEIYGEVFGDVVAILGQVTVHPHGAVHGDVVTLVGVIDLQSGGQIDGDQVSLGGLSKKVSLSPLRGLTKFSPGRSIFNVVVRVLFALLIGALFPLGVARISAKIETQIGPSAGAGILAWLAVPPLAIIMALTIIGIPLSLLVLVALWAAYQVGFTSISMIIGKRFLPNSMEGNIGPVVLGALILSLLIALPLLGWLVRISVGLVGVGAVALTRFGTQRTI